MDKRQRVLPTSAGAGCVAGGDVPIASRIVQGTFFTTPSLRSANRQTVINFSKATDKAPAFLRSSKNADKLGPIAAEHIPGSDEGQDQNSIKHLLHYGIFPANTSVSSGEFDKSLGFQNAVQASETALRCNFSYKQMVDSTIASKALVKH